MSLLQGVMPLQVPAESGVVFAQAYRCALLRNPSALRTSQIKPVTLSRVQPQSVALLPRMAEGGNSLPSLAILV